VAERQQQSPCSASDVHWLAFLVDTFESAERLTDVPCDVTSRLELRARLARPAMSQDISQDIQTQNIHAAMPRDAA
jgi:hypothetical protein